LKELKLIIRRTFKLCLRGSQGQFVSLEPSPPPPNENFISPEFSLPSPILSSLLNYLGLKELIKVFFFFLLLGLPVSTTPVP
jgi:hypothetical protein